MHPPELPGTPGAQVFAQRACLLCYERVEKDMTPPVYPLPADVRAADQGSHLWVAGIPAGTSLKRALLLLFKIC